MPWRQTPSRKKKAVVFTTVTANAYQGRLNAGFSKVCEIFKVCGIESLKYIREFHTPVCFCGDISTPRNVTLNETNCDWLFDISVKWPHGRALTNECIALPIFRWTIPFKVLYRFPFKTEWITCWIKSLKFEMSKVFGEEGEGLEGVAREGSMGTEGFMFLVLFKYLNGWFLCVGARQCR